MLPVDARKIIAGDFLELRTRAGLKNDKNQIYLGKSCKLHCFMVI
jgi:hypothetical protein